MALDNITSPVQAGAAACADDTAPAGTLAALALLLADLRTDAEALRELLAGAEPTALHVVLRDALALMSWRMSFGQGIATDAADTTSAAARQFIGAAVLHRVGGPLHPPGTARRP